MKRTAGLVSLCLSLTAFTGPTPRAHAAAEPAKPAPELFLAMEKGDAAAVKGLLAHGADPNARNTIGMPVLLAASAYGTPEVIRVLLAAGADVNATSPFGTPLTFAASRPTSDVGLLLLQKGAGVTSGRLDRISILMMAARAGHADLVKQLLAKKADVNAVDNHGSTALSYAARAGQTETARLLLAAGATVDIADSDAWTPLMHAAVNGHGRVAALLLQKGANPRLRDKKGRTALVLAAAYGDSAEAVRALLARGAEINAVDQKGRTALELTETRGYSGTASVLRENGARRAAAVSAPVRSPREAAQASLRQVEHAMEVFSQRTGCVSCHHEGVARVSTGFALGRGFEVNTKLAQEQQKRILAFAEEMRPLNEKALKNPAETKNIPIVDVGDLATMWGGVMFGLAEHRTPANEALGAAAMVTARTQTPDGDWHFGLVREPVQSSFVATTAMMVRAMKTYAPKEYADEVAQRTAKAKQWLLTAPVSRTEDLVFRLLGLKWAGATAEERQKSLEALRAGQRPDGGWAQLPGVRSDAYATGSALVALNQGGDLPVTDPVYQRGVQFLLRTQEEDGTWYVYKRAVPGNNYFDAEFPYGQSQYISQVGASWASVALMLAADAPGGPQRAAR